MKERINIIKILETAPSRLKLWCDVLGEVEINCINFVDNFIIVENRNKATLRVNKYGAMYWSGASSLPCILWPSEDHRTWKNWQQVLLKKNNVVVLDSSGSLSTSIISQVSGDGLEVYSYSSIVPKDLTWSSIYEARWADKTEKDNFFPGVIFKWFILELYKRHNV